MSSHEKCYSNYQRQVISKLEELFGDDAFTYERSANNHLQIKVEGIDRVFFTSSTPSDHRSFDNFISDIRSAQRQQEHEAALRRANDQPPPASLSKFKAKKAVQAFMDKQSQKIRKDFKNRLPTLKKQEYDVVVQAGTEDRGDAMREFRKKLIKNEIEQALSARDNKMFVPPGLMKKTQKQIEESLNYMLPTVAEYHSLILAQEKQASVLKSAEECLKDGPSPEVQEPSVPQTQVAQKQQTQAPVSSMKAEQSHRGKGADDQPANLKDDAPPGLSELLHQKPHKRLAALKQLSKQQITLLMDDCGKAIEEKHQEDIQQLARQIKDKGVSIAELAAALEG